MIPSPILGGSKVYLPSLLFPCLVLIELRFYFAYVKAQKQSIFITGRFFLQVIQRSVGLWTNCSISIKLNFTLLFQARREAERKEADIQKKGNQSSLTSYFDQKPEKFRYVIFFKPVVQIRIFLDPHYFGQQILQSIPNADRRHEGKIEEILISIFYDPDGLQTSSGICKFFVEVYK